MLIFLLMLCVLLCWYCVNVLVSFGLLLLWLVLVIVLIWCLVLDVRIGFVGRVFGFSVCFKLMFSYVGFFMLVGFLLLVVVWVFLLCYVFEVLVGLMFGFDCFDLLVVFVLKVVVMLVFLLMFGLFGGWILVGSMFVFFMCIIYVICLVVDGLLFYWIWLEGC